GFHSLALLAVCDATYRFTYVDVGAYGSEGDCNIFRNSQFGRNDLNDRLPFPANAMLNGVSLPLFFVADDAFPLCKRIMKPCHLPLEGGAIFVSIPCGDFVSCFAAIARPSDVCRLQPFNNKNMPTEEVIYNYRLSRARRCIENAFGLLCTKWACLKKTLYCGPDRAQKIMAACCMLTF
ncbi:uncharacterized protein LOC134202477, partial [Armigeres subalbatus]|uniref:uncharacterized protein LOC134202477 n=1 Tax=Armigeres subalbatus TaxID=124917 RepID=UPI002ECFF1F2